MSESNSGWVFNESREDVLSGHFGGLRVPDRFTAYFADGVSTEDGENFDEIPFEVGNCSGTFLIVDEEVGSGLYESVSVCFTGRKFMAKNNESFNDCAIGTWNLGDGKVALLTIDTGSDSFAQEVLEKMIEIRGVSCPKNYFSIHKMSELSFVEGNVVEEELLGAIKSLSNSLIPIVKEPAADGISSLVVVDEDDFEIDFDPDETVAPKGMKR